MTITPADVMRHIHNHFVSASVCEAWELTDGVLSPSGWFDPGEWIAIPDAGAVTGVHQLDEYGHLPDLSDYRWTGDILLLAPPADFLRLCREIADWADKHPDVTAVSEHFGAYSRTQSSPAWEKVFAEALKPYRRVYPEVKC